MSSRRSFRSRTPSVSWRKTAATSLRRCNLRIPSGVSPANTTGAASSISISVAPKSYPDPASFLARLLGHDVPTSWLPATTGTAVARLGSLSGATRDRAAIALALQLERRDGPIVAYGTPTVETLLGAETRPQRIRCLRLRTRPDQAVHLERLTSDRFADSCWDRSRSE